MRAIESGLYTSSTTDSPQEAWRYVTGDKIARRPPQLLTRDYLARCIVREYNPRWHTAPDLDNLLPAEKQATIQPMQTFPVTNDLMTEVSWNFEVKRRIKPFKARKPDARDGDWRMSQQDVDRVQEFGKCIECFLCQDACQVLPDHHLHEQFIGPRFLEYAAA